MVGAGAGRERMVPVEADKGRRNPMALNDVWRLSCVGSHSGTELAIITLHFKDLGTTGTIDGLCSDIKTLFLNVLKTSQATTFRWDQINALTVNTIPPRAFTYTTGMPLTGTIANEEPAHQVAAVVTHRTAYAGRSYRGRNYIPGLPESAWSASLLDAAYLANLETYYQALMTAYHEGGGDGEWSWVVWSEKLSQANDVQSFVVRNNPGVIRRRRIGVGQ